jgi:membrane associated rhomboid family serine protease
MFSFTIIFLLIISGVSLYAFNQPEFQERLVMQPVKIVQKKERYRFLSSALIHSDYFHLFFNVFTLYFFGDSVEHILALSYGSWGKWIFCLLFLGGVWFSNYPLFVKYKKSTTFKAFGASGGVSAVVFAHVLYYPTHDICLYFICIPAFLYAILFLGYSYYESKRLQANTLPQQHIFGAIFGLVLAILIRPIAVIEFFKQIFGL